MGALASLLLWAVQPTQEDPALQARELVEKLRSDRVEEREEAARRLKDLGKAARPELEKAARSGDAELAGRARHLIRTIEVRQDLPRKLLEVSPGIVDRLVVDDHACTELYLKVMRRPGDPRLIGSDWNSLAPRAVRGARTSEEKRAVFFAVEEGDHRSALPEMLAGLEEGDKTLCAYAGDFLSKLGALEDADRIARLLTHEDAFRRSAACTVLGRIGARAYASGIARLLGDPEVGETAATATRTLRSRDAVPILAGFLGDERRAVRLRALSVLVDLHEPEAARDLLPLLKDEDPAIREGAVWALGGPEAPGVAAWLIPLLRDDRENVRCAAIHALAAVDTAETRGALRALLKDPSREVRRAAAGSLSTPRDQGAIPDLIRALEDGDARDAAVRSLGFLRARDAVNALMGLLGGNDHWLRIASADALANIGAREAIPEIVKMIDQDEPNMARSAGDVLGALGGAEAVPELRRLLHSKSGPVRAAAVRALGQVDSREAVPGISELLKDEDASVREAACEALGYLGVKASVPALLPLLGDASPQARTGAVRAVGALHVREAFPQVLALLRDGELNVGAIRDWRRLLKACVGPEHVKLLLPLLEGPNGHYRILAAELLGRLQGKEALPTILDVMRARGSWLVDPLYDAVVEMGATEAVPEIVRRLKGGDISQRVAAAGALCRLGSKEGVATLLADAAQGDRMGLAYLNALRRPDLRKRLEKDVPMELRIRTAREGWGRLSATLGLKLDAPDGDRWSIEPYRTFSDAERMYRWLRDEQGSVSFWRAVEEWVPSTHTVLVEGEVVRIVPFGEGLAFWKTWWERQTQDREAPRDQ